MAGVQELSPLQTSSRRHVLDGLDQFIESSEARLEEVLLKTGWTRKSLEGTEMVTCPMDPGHSVPESALAQHIDRCQWAQEGYSREEYVDTPSSAFFYQNTGTVFSLKLDQAKQNEILTSVNGTRSHAKARRVCSHEYCNVSCDPSPSTQNKAVPQMTSPQCEGGPTQKPVARTPARAGSNFTQAEKLALYDHVVAESQRSRQSSTSVRVLSEIGEDAEAAGGSGKSVLVKSESKRLTRLEALKQMRDYKRRRQSYRAKNVHITKRSQTDIMREIIANQMEELEAEQRASSVIGGQRPASSVIGGERRASSEVDRSGIKKEGGGGTESGPSPSLVDGPALNPTHRQEYSQETNGPDQRSGRSHEGEDGRAVRNEEPGSRTSEGGRLNQNHHEENGSRSIEVGPGPSREGSRSPESDRSSEEGRECNGERAKSRNRSPSAKRSSRHRHKHKKHKKHKKGSR